MKEVTGMPENRPAKESPTLIAEKWDVIAAEHSVSPLLQEAIDDIHALAERCEAEIEDKEAESR